MATEGSAEATGMAGANAAVAAQARLAAFAMEKNVEMAWLQLWLSLSGKIAGR